MMVNSAQPGVSEGAYALPLSLYLPSREKLSWTLQLRGKIHPSYFSSTFFSPVVLTISKLLFTTMWIVVLHFLFSKQCRHTDEKDNKIFHKYKEIQKGAVANSYMTKGFLIYEEMRKYLVKYEEAVSHRWLCNWSIWNYLIYEENFILFFISTQSLHTLIFPYGCLPPAFL